MHTYKDGNKQFNLDNEGEYVAHVSHVYIYECTFTFTHSESRNRRWYTYMRKYMHVPLITEVKGGTHVHIHSDIDVSDL